MKRMPRGGKRTLALVRDFSVKAEGKIHCLPILIKDEEVNK